MFALEESSLCVFLLLRLASRSSGVETLGGPRFLQQVSGKEVAFSNSTGLLLSCKAAGQPQPVLTWERETATGWRETGEVGHVLRILSNGSLSFLPFDGQDFQREIHAGGYRCRASNSAGTIVSNTLKIRAVLDEDYEARAEGDDVPTGNPAVLRCSWPSHSGQGIRLQGWIDENGGGVSDDLSSPGRFPRLSSFPLRFPLSSKGFVRGRTDVFLDRSGSRYSVLESGELVIRGVTILDDQSGYRCVTWNPFSGRKRTSSSSARIRVTERQIDTKPWLHPFKSDWSVEAGGRARIPCVSRGHPLPSIRWQAGTGETIKGIWFVREGNLVVENATRGHAGRYECLAQNPLGEARMEYRLRVVEPVQVKVEPQMIRLDEGKSGNFTCIVTAGFPEPAIYWLHNGTALNYTGKVLRIPEMREDHEGMYQCMAENGDSSAQASAQVALGDRIPVFVETFSRETLKPGENVTLRCVMKGSPLPSVTWRRDSLPLPIDEPRLETNTEMEGDRVASTLTLRDVRVEDGGTYACVAVAPAAARHEAVLPVYGLPYVRPLGNVTVAAGGDVRVDCRATSHPLQRLRWESQGGAAFAFSLLASSLFNMPLPLQEGDPESLVATLSLKKVEKGDEGIYTCVAVAPSGASFRRDLHLLVQVPPKVSLSGFSEGLREGDRVVLSCSVTQGDLPTSLTWFKDDRTLDSPRVDGFSIGLSVGNLSLEDEGNYTCVAENPAGSSSASHDLRLLVPPRWVDVETEAVRVVRGGNVSLRCSAEGFPAPNLTWFPPLNSSRTEPILLEDSSELFLDEVTETDEGYYVCQADNGIGSPIKEYVRVDVLVPPEMQERPMDEIEVSEGDALELTCSASGEQPMNPIWSVRGERIPRDSPRFNVSSEYEGEGEAGSLRTRLAVQGIRPEDEGSYSCLLANSVGDTTATTRVHVVQLPRAPTGLRVTQVTGNSATLTWNSTSSHLRFALQWKAPGFPCKAQIPIRLRWVVNQLNEATDVTGEDGEAELEGSAGTARDLRSGSEYWLRLRVTNRLNASSVYSEPVQVFTAPPPPEGIRGWPLDNQSLLVSWTVPEKRGSLSGFRIRWRKSESPGEENGDNYVNVPWNESKVAISDLEGNEEYSIWVQSMTPLGGGEKSSPPLRLLTGESEPPGSPRGVECGVRDYGGLQVSWEALQDPFTDYHVLFHREGEGEEEGEVSTKNSSVFIADIQWYSTYTFRVKAENFHGSSSPSEPISCSVTQLAPKLGRIEEVKAGPGSVGIYWEPKARDLGWVQEFQVRVSTASSSNSSSSLQEREEVVPGDRRWVVFEGLKPGNSYHVRVQPLLPTDDAQPHLFFLLTEDGEGEGEGEGGEGDAFPPGILSFGEQREMGIGSTVRFPCPVQGVPTPTRSWTLDGKELMIGGSRKKEVLVDGSLIVYRVFPSDSGLYSCTATNRLGQDSVSFQLVVRSREPDIMLHLNDIGYTDASFVWDWDVPHPSMLSGYHLRAKGEGKGWWTESFPRETLKGKLEGLGCGGSYVAYLTPFWGPHRRLGRPSNEIYFRTRGTKPLAPGYLQVIKYDPSSPSTVILNLASWTEVNSGQLLTPCPILTLSVQYRPTQDPKTGRGDENAPWNLLVNASFPKGLARICDVQKGVWYVIRMTAVNEAGTTVANYEFFADANFTAVHERCFLPGIPQEIQSRMQGWRYEEARPSSSQTESDLKRKEDIEERPDSSSEHKFDETSFCNGIQVEEGPHSLPTAPNQARDETSLWKREGGDEEQDIPKTWGTDLEPSSWENSSSFPSSSVSSFSHLMTEM
ncbi:unnamed protein product [Darwinula stevensoni]|uniref:Uncharacterized protein n=1 Tax=Darwinula stevensoni TaxID=69355 RepID=A0A7R9A0F6_9CRUS|nr:unnamed protein product [Darwinula stevensoni]CAG0880994.1 unnamed protein product [Darwinula stevensoni]